MNFFLPHICIFVILFKSVSVDGQNQFHPFLLYFFYDAPLFRFPLDKIPSTSDANIITLCPPETEEDKRNFYTISKTFLQAKYCLFRKDFFPIDEPKFCREQPKPWLELELLNNIDEQLCGTSPKHKQFRIGFYFCGPSELLIDFRKKPDEPSLVAKFRSILEYLALGRRVLPQFHKIYNLCIDTTNGKTFWTKHNIMTPAMFTDNEEKLQQESGGDTEISTDPIRFEANTFINLKQKFLSQNEESFKMTENFMVPREHVALRVWRNAVNHFINVAPLWDKLEKLMISVNQAIKKIALQLTKNKQKLTVYTRAIDSNDGDETTSQVNGQFSNSMWYKLLREDISETATLIVLHNTPNSPPEEKKCETKMACDFKNWYKKNADDGDEGIPDEVFEYVYCCNPTPPEILKLFGLDLTITGPLNLDSVF
ncbi:uncharacterized protein LOC135842603 [Planococcus citri]|uniref:uncharacterized protein LOC135842603 n=1 Tax=Planococcus citri TaxID=170843 RepID=UPI0031F8F3C4